MCFVKLQIYLCLFVTKEKFKCSFIRKFQNQLRIWKSWKELGSKVPLCAGGKLSHSGGNFQWWCGEVQLELQEVRRPHIHTRSILVWAQEVVVDYNDSNLEQYRKEYWNQESLQFLIQSGYYYTRVFLILRSTHSYIN